MEPSEKNTWLIPAIATAFLLISAVGPVQAAGLDKTGLSGKRPSVQTYTPTDDKWGTSEELFSGYVDREMMTGGENADPGKTEDSSNQPGSISAKNDTGSRLLTGGNKAVYQALRTLIAETAAGKRESTEYEIGVDFAAFGLENKRFTAKDLGVTSLTEAGTSISDEANDAMLDKLNFDLDKVITALLVDCPYDLYWYDKTRSDDSEGTSAWMQAYYSVRKDNNWNGDI